MNMQVSVLLDEQADCPALSCLQVNTRKIYDEANVLEGVFDNKIFSTILAAELALQVGHVALLRQKTCSDACRCKPGLESAMRSLQPWG